MKKYLFGTLSVGLVLGGIICAGAVFARNYYIPATDYITQWTNSNTFQSHAESIDDFPCNGATEYVSTDALGNFDTYFVDISNIPAGRTITSISLTPCAATIGPGLAWLEASYQYKTPGFTGSNAGEYLLSSTNFNQLAPQTFSGLTYATGNPASSSLAITARYAGNVGVRMSNYLVYITWR